MSAGAAVPIPTLFVEKLYTSPFVSIASPPARVEVALPSVATRYAPANLPVVVALVPVAFTKVKFWRVVEEVTKSVESIVEEAVERKPFKKPRVVEVELP